MKKRIGIQGSLIFIAVVATILFSSFLFPQRANAASNLILDCLGAGALLLGFVFRISARGYKSENSDNGKQLVTGGPYAVIKNPMYFGTLLIGSGVIMALFEWWVFPIFLAIFLLIYIPQIAKEEKLLSEHFGDRYKEYAASTPGYFPGGQNFFKADLKSRLSFKWAWVRREFNPLAGLVVLLAAAKAWQTAKVYGSGVYPVEAVRFIIIILFFGIMFSILFAGKK